MKKLPWCLLGVGWLVGSARADEPAELARQARAILKNHCASCHGGAAAKGGFGFVLERDRLVGRSLILPGKARDSELYLRVEQGEMPPPAKKPRPTPTDLKLLQRWLDAGAPDWDAPVAARQTLSEQDAAGIIIADLKSAEPRRRRFLRYLTLTHLVAAGRPEKDLSITRQATAKLLNSLSWHPRLRLPVGVDGTATILRIDLRDYKWTASLWDKMTSAYPYRLDLWDMRTVSSLAGTEAPALRADWFVASAARPPLYHDLLQLPATDRALERLLQVDVPGNLQDDNLLRAGFNDSGVSKNNRLIERHDAAHGALWRSHDFAGNTGRQNIFEHPLGPNAGATSFQPAGGEIIFHLPNGLLGFMLVDAQGRRIDKAPGEIVGDPRRPDQRVETGISCMSCHARGLLPKADQVRGHVEKTAAVFGRQVVEAVRAVHPNKAVFQAQVERDNAGYLKALESFGIRDADQEPINLVTQRFEGTLDGRTVAAELGMSTKDLLVFLKKHSDMARVVGSALAVGGTIQRETFQDNFPELARRVLAGMPRATDIAGEDAAFKGHHGPVHCVAIAADGTRAASSGADGVICLWEIPRGKLLARLEGAGEVDAIAFAPNGKTLLSAGRDRLVRLWELEAGKPARVFQGHTDRIRCVAFSTDGKHAVSGGDDRSLRVWNVNDGRELAGFVGHAKAVSSVAWSADGKHIVSGSHDGTIRLWDWAAARQVRVLEGHAGAVLSVATSPDGTTALSGGNDKTVRWWRLSTGEELHCFQGHANAVIHVQFSIDGQSALSSSSQHRSPDRLWRRWDLKRRAEAGSMRVGDEVRIGCAVFSPDGRHVLAGGPAGFLRLWSWSP